MKKYKIVYTDPPWRYKDRSLGRGGAEVHYNTMSVEDICALPVKNIVDDNAVLFLWVTYPQLFEAEKIINAWGFKYTTGGFTWVKTNQDGTVFMGMGRSTRSNAEICLLAKRGKGLERISTNICNTQLHSRAEHSKKPDKFRNDIVLLYGDQPRIELFARKPKQLSISPELDSFNGWDVWGNEVDSDIFLSNNV